MTSRRSFTLKEKAEIISKMKNGANNADLCKEYKVSHSTISTMWKNRDKILECFESKSTKIKRNRKATHHDIENALLVWFKAQRSQNVTLSSRLLQEKANHLAKLFGKIDFECSEGWIYRFRQRYDILTGKVCRRGTSVLRSDCDNRLKRVCPKLTEDYTDSHIWNADKTDLVVKEEYFDDQFDDCSNNILSDENSDCQYQESETEIDPIKLALCEDLQICDVRNINDNTDKINDRNNLEYENKQNGSATSSHTSFGNIVAEELKAVPQHKQCKLMIKILELIEEFKS